MAKVFMSHSSKDRPFVRRLSEDLRKVGHEPWLDEWEIKVGECIASKISHGINEADYAVLVLTPDSIKSGWVGREWKSLYWSEIQEAEVKLLPLLLRKCEIPRLLRSIRYADFTSQYEVGLSEIMEALSVDAVNIRSGDGKENSSQARFQHLDPKKLTFIFESVAAGQRLEVEAVASVQVSELKRLVMEEMRFSNQFLDGRTASTHLYSVTRGVMLHDYGTLGENGVRDGETLRLGFQALGG